MIKGPLGLLVVSDTMNDNMAVKHTDLVALHKETTTVVMTESVKVAA